MHMVCTSCSVANIKRCMYSRIGRADKVVADSVNKLTSWNKLLKTWALVFCVSEEKTVESSAQFAEKKKPFFLGCNSRTQLPLLFII